MAIVRRLLPFFREHKPRFGAALLAMLGIAPLSVFSLSQLKGFIDNALTTSDLTVLRNIVLAIIGAFLLKALLSYAHDYLTSYVGQAVVRELRDRAYAHIHDLSLDFYSGNDSSRLIARLTNDAQLVQNALTKIPIMVIRDGFQIIALAAYLLYLHWKFSLMAFVLLPLAGYFIARFGKSLRKTSRQGQAKMSDLFLLIQETVAGAPVVKAFQREDDERARFRHENLAFFGINMKNARVESLSHPVMEFLGALALAALLWFGGKDVITGVWTAGAFFTFITVALTMYQPVKNFARSNATLQQALSGAERIFEIMDTQPSIVERPGAAALGDFSSDIRFENVHFHYRPDRPVLKDVNLAIRKGEAVALVGPSGSGKTTLAALLLRFYDPVQGRITVDGRDLRDATLHSLRRQIGLVSQDTLLFNNSVRYNIAYGRPDAPDADVVAAARAANAWEFIEKLPQGLDTLVGERGLLLSGGQKQRLAIARAILKNPPILLLDEATSALDAASEKLVQEAVERLMKNRTVIVIAHRLATVKNADRIVVLEDGRMAETGTHGELLARKGLYFKLYELQILEA
jgi:ATP-binding cassette, subfamily B, bacterial MsbA